MESGLQTALRLGTQAVGYAVTGNIPGVVGTAYEALGHLPASSGPIISAKTAPAVASASISGSFANTHEIIPQGTNAENSIRLKGTILIGTLRANITSYSLNAGSVDYTLSDNAGDFAITLQGSTLVAGSTYSGFPRVFNPPDAFLASMARNYQFWRPNSLALRYVPIVPTSTSGSVSLAWRATDTDNWIEGNTMYGSAPFSVKTLSQYPAFTTGPMWAPNGISINPRKNGICENVKDWLTVDSYVRGSSGSFDGNDAIESKYTSGYFTIHPTGYGVVVSGYVELGYIIFDFDYTLHVHTVPKQYIYSYGLSLPEFTAYQAAELYRYHRFQRDRKARQERKKAPSVTYSPDDPCRPLTPETVDEPILVSPPHPGQNISFREPMRR